MPSLLARLLTRSFPGKAEAQSGELPGPVTEKGEGSDAASAEHYESRALQLWAEDISALSAPRILDLGRIHPKSLAYFQSLNASVGVMSLDTTLAGTGFEMRLEQHADWGPFDGVLCWDLLNYLGNDELKLLGAWLHQRCGSRAVVMASLTTRAPYSSQPARYAIESASKLVCMPSQDAEASRSETHSSAELAKLWPGFESVRSFLLRNGMQEFVLRHREGH
ncbi:MAG: hypothetical protein QNJ40_19045 [Xanthomonadales bacterium]|nr:hypothetical protein [Xanthomonadales bacterium]